MVLRRDDAVLEDDVDGAKATQPRKIRDRPASVACSVAPKVKNCTRPSLRM
jgi:hypothetical protein